MTEVLKKLGQIGIVPVVVIEDVEDALPLAKALSEGGLPCAEVTFRTQAAEEAIQKMCRAFPKMLVGAGTVLTVDQAKRAAAFGAKFIVSPGFDRKVVEYCIENKIPVTPGCETPSEIQQAMECGLEVVKFFPAEPAGGIKKIKAMAAPFRSLKFMPTGGISPENVREYLSYDRILACGGSWMVKSGLIKSGDFAQIRELSKEAAELVKEARG